MPAGERGVIDAAEFVNPYHDEALGFEDVWSIHYAPGLPRNRHRDGVLFNKEIWDSIPEDLQNIILATTQSHFFYWETHKMTQNRNAMERLTGSRRRVPADAGMTSSPSRWMSGTRFSRPSTNDNPAFKAIADSQLAYAERNVRSRAAFWSLTGRPLPTSTGRRAVWSRAACSRWTTPLRITTPSSSLIDSGRPGA